MYTIHTVKHSSDLTVSVRR